MTETRLGMQWITRDHSEAEEQLHLTPDPEHGPQAVPNSLWPTRWPAIALQECIDKIEAADPANRTTVRFNLPCATCPKAPGCLNAKRKEIGSLMFDREILTQPRTSESSLFPTELTSRLLNHKRPCAPHYVKPFGAEHQWAVVQAWDIAWSERTGGDWLVCVTATVNLHSGRRILLDVERWRQKTFDEQVRLIEQKWIAYNADLVVIEGDAAQQVWKQHVGRNTAVPVISHSAADGKQSLSTGVPNLLIKFENRKWEIPYVPGGHHHEVVEIFLAELEAFGWVDGKLQGVGEHDDTVMAFWHCDWGIDKLVREGATETHRGIQPGKQV